MAFKKPYARQLVLLGAFVTISGSIVAQTPSQALLVAAQGKVPGENALLIIDPATRKVVSRVPLGGQPHNIAVSSDGKFAFTANATRGVEKKNFPGVRKGAGDPDQLPVDTLSVVDLVAQKELRLIELGPGSNPHGIAFAAGKVYFTAEGYKLAGRYDPVRNRVDWMAGVGQERVHELVVTRDGSQIFTANMNSGTVVAIGPGPPDVAGQPVTEQPPAWIGTVIPVGNRSEGIGMTPDEKEVWVLKRSDGSASIIDVATKRVLQTIDLKSKDPLRISFTPDGTRALISDATSGDLLVLDRAARKEIKRIANVGKQVHGINVSPDGAFAYAASQSSADIAIIDMKTLEIAGHIPTGTGLKAFDGIDGSAWAERK